MRDDIEEKADGSVELDNLFRNALSGQKVEPSTSLWKGISRRLMWRELLHFNFTNLSGNVVGFGVAAIAVVTAITYFALRDSHSPVAVTPVTPAHDLGSVAAPSPVTATPSPLPEVKHTQTTSTSSPSTVKREQSVFVTSEHAGASSIVKANQQPSTPTLTPNASSVSPSTSILQVVPSTRDEAGAISALEPHQPLLLFGTPAEDTLVIVTPTEVIKINRSYPAGKQSFFSATLGFEPEAMFYGSPEPYSKTNFWVNGGVTWHYANFSVGLTPGLGLVYDDGKYSIHYKSLDSIGYYNKVVSYSINPVTNLIEYHTEMVNVYDSVLHVADDRTRNRYTYLQVPLMLGYRIFQTNAVSLSLNAGPAVSFLIGKKEAEPVVGLSNGRLIRIDNETPARVDVTWQAWAGFYFEYRFSPVTSLYLQPNCKYYFTPTVESEGVQYKNPWSVGLGVGLQFNFGQKRRQP